MALAEVPVDPVVLVDRVAAVACIVQHMIPFSRRGHGEGVGAQRTAGQHQEGPITACKDLLDLSPTFTIETIEAELPPPQVGLGEVHPHAREDLRPSAATESALFLGLAPDSALPAVGLVVHQVHAQPLADLPALFGADAVTIDAGLVRVAGQIALPAVLEVRAEVPAGTPTVHEQGVLTYAEPLLAYEPRVADSRAAAAVRGIYGSVDAMPLAALEPLAAGLHALALVALHLHRALVAAGSAVVRVGLQVHADAAAVGLVATAHGLAAPFTAGLTLAAGVMAAAAVLVVAQQGGALFLAAVLPFLGAAGRAGPLVAAQTRSADLAAAPAVAPIALQVDAVRAAALELVLARGHALALSAALALLAALLAYPAVLGVATWIYAATVAEQLPFGALEAAARVRGAVVRVLGRPRVLGAPGLAQVGRLAIWLSGPMTILGSRTPSHGRCRDKEGQQQPGRGQVEGPKHEPLSVPGHVSLPTGVEPARDHSMVVTKPAAGKKGLGRAGIQLPD